MSPRAARWLLPAALLALTPKCVLCVLAYAGAGTALGLGGAEWCRATENASFSWVTAFALTGAAGVGVWVGSWARSLFDRADKKASQ